MPRGLPGTVVHITTAESLVITITKDFSTLEIGWAALRSGLEYFLPNLYTSLHFLNAGLGALHHCNANAYVLCSVVCNAVFSTTDVTTVGDELAIFVCGLLWNAIVASKQHNM